MNIKKVPVVSIILYVLAVVLVGYSIWAIVYTSGIVSQAVSMNQLVVSGNEFEVISFYMSNVAQYLLFAVVLFGLGWILQTISFQNSEDYEDESDFFVTEDNSSDEAEDDLLEE